MNKIVTDPIDKIKNVLISSPFGSGYNAAEMIDESVFDLPDGIYKITVLDDGETSIEPSKRFGYPNWASELSTYILVENDYVIFRLGCGIHSADYRFNRSGDLVAVDPDSFPSQRFWGDGECKLQKREAMLLKRALLAKEAK
jgi:hypothetical protein